MRFSNIIALVAGLQVVSALPTHESAGKKLCSKPGWHCFEDASLTGMVNIAWKPVIRQGQ